MSYILCTVLKLLKVLKPDSLRYIDAVGLQQLDFLEEFRGLLVSQYLSAPDKDDLICKLGDLFDVVLHYDDCHLEVFFDGA